MSLVFSAIVPHPLILIPQIGKEHISRLELTQKAYEKLAIELQNSGADTIIIISPHGIIQNDVFTINLNPIFNANFEEFGDFSTKLNFKGNIGLTHKIREKLETKAKLQMISLENLDYGASVPLYFLTQKLPNIKIMPIYYSGLNYTEHFKFGQLLKKQILASKDNIAILASGDLSHRLNKNAPGGYSAKAKKFDSRIIELLQKNKIADLISIDDNLIKEAGECGLKSIIILMGIMDAIKYEPQLFSYEFPFGVGYMVMNLKL
jgi:aromatic ring-opening dioxygenase LigB subunit